jgi:folate-dependent tRNA-U54 methylase TrmFO/GidA
MNVNFGLLPPDPKRVRKKHKKERRVERGRQCVASFRTWAQRVGMASVAPRLTAA